MLRRNLGSRLGKWSMLVVGMLTAVVIATIAHDRLTAQDKAKADQNGDALPAGALARMGTLRWRHGDTVSFVAFTPDGKGVVTAAQDSSIRLWDRETGKEIRRFHAAAPLPQPGVGRPGVVMGWNAYGRGSSRIAMSRDGKFLATVLLNNFIQLWDVDTGKELRQIKGPINQINAIVFAPDGKSIAARGYDRTTYLLETETGKEIRQLKGKAAPAGGRVLIGGQAGSEGLAFSHDGKTIATSEMVFEMQKVNTYLVLTETDTGKEIRTIDVQGNLSGIAFSPDGKTLVFGNGNAIQFRAADTGKEIRKVDHPNGVAALVFSPGGKTLAAKGRDQIIRLYDADTGKASHNLGDAPAALGANGAFVSFYVPETRDIAFSHDSKVIAAGGQQTVRFFTVATGKEQALAGGHRSAVSAVLITPDGKTMVSRGVDGVIRRWDALTGKEQGQFLEPKGTIGVVFSPDGKTAALAVNDGTIRVLNVADGKERHNLKGHANGTAALAFSPDSKILASRGSVDGTIRLFDTVNGGELKQFNLPGANPMGGAFIARNAYGIGGVALVFSPDGQTLASNVNVSNVMIRQPGGVAQPAGSNAIHMWDVSTAKEIRKITLPANRNVTNLAFSPDGRVLAAENADQTLSLWEIASGRERALLGAPAGAGQPGMPIGVVGGGGFGVIGRATNGLTTKTLAFSPDGSLLATRNTDQTVRVWQVAHTKEIGVFKGHEGAIQAIAFAPDGKSLASASADTTLLVWDVAGLKRMPNAPVVNLAAKEAESQWADLNSDNAGTAWRAIQTLASAPKSAPTLFSDKLKPATPPDLKKIEKFLADLDSTNFPKRTKASEELEKLGELAIPALKNILDTKPTPEVRRRVEPILEKLTTGVMSAEQVRVVRAVETLENLGTDEARQVLETLAKGAPGALPTRHAQMALDRLGRR